MLEFKVVIVGVVVAYAMELKSVAAVEYIKSLTSFIFKYITLC